MLPERPGANREKPKVNNESGKPMLRNYFLFILICLVGEIVFHLLFWLIGRLYAFEQVPGSRGREAFKGFLERLVLTAGIAHGIITVVIAFAGLKVATKLSLSATEPRDEVKKHNDYFLVGNLLSILFALVYAVIGRAAKLVTFTMPG